MERVFLAETRTPARASFDGAESLKAMRYMRRVIDNRLNSHNPKYGAPRHAKTQTDVIKMRTQFQGFGSYPVLPAYISTLILDCLKIANSEHDKRSAAYAQFVENAILAATELTPPSDSDIPANLVGWVTQGTAAPGPNYIFAGSVQGNDFYSVLKIEPPSPRRTGRAQHR